MKCLGEVRRKGGWGVGGQEGIVCGCCGGGGTIRIEGGGKERGKEREREIGLCVLACIPGCMRALLSRFAVNTWAGISKFGACVFMSLVIDRQCCLAD